MQDGGDFRQFVFKVAEASQPEQKRWLRFRETLDTTILGTLSTSLGVVVLVDWFTGLFWYWPARMARTGPWQGPCHQPRLDWSRSPAKCSAWQGSRSGR